MKAFKGFTREMKCRDFQFEEGQTYEEPVASLCNSGFHACEHPLNCFAYYPPSKSVYHEVENGGNMAFTVSTVKYTFFATDGSSVSAITTGEGMDVADKSTNKAMAAAMKYAFFQTFCIPTEEIGHDDPDLETPPESVPMPSQQETPPVIWMCEQCKRAINATKTRTSQQVAESTKARYGRRLCSACANREQRELDAIAAESQHDNAGDDV